MLNIAAIVKEYNEKYFQGKVNMPVHTYYRKGRTHGFFKVKREKNALDKTGSLHFNLTHSASVNGMKETILHEMTHAYLWITNRPHKHTPQFKRMMRDLLKKEFGVVVASNPRFVVDVDALIAAQKKPVLTITMPTVTNRFKVKNNGMIGTLKGYSQAWGRKMITLNVEGNLFPFTTEVSNVVAI